jgi:hypothetical protein
VVHNPAIPNLSFEVGRLHRFTFIGYRSIGAVLPLATGLVGFAGGVVTAMFRTSTTAPSIPSGQTPP